MHSRCNRIGDKSYNSYGGRGIVVCERWNSLAMFCEDMGPRPSARHTLDRIDNDGDYTPENCRWATPKQQARNTRGNTLIAHNNKVQCVAEWAEASGVNRTTIDERLKRGWPSGKAIETPANRRRANLNIDAGMLFLRLRMQGLVIREVAELCGVDMRVVCRWSRRARQFIADLENCNAS